ncbi:sodium:proton antiporter [Patescibacteria group bacterium]|jgi:CPA1 family monovalent cation:H+ antiporter|nr:sodium:proton antiporter [Patescibacteria group bacterium]
MLELSTLLIVCAVLTISSLAVFWSKALRVPHTVLLVAFGVLIGLLSTSETFSFLTSFHLTPEVLFFIFLPALIFESAYNISIRKLASDSAIISLFAVVSLLVSTVAIGYGLSFLLSLIGIEVPLSITLLFGALISATDPVAVLALFKEYGAPRRLSLIFEGESLFNDATSVALFLILLEVVLHGFNGSQTLLEGSILFSFMIASGVLFGVLCGVVFAKCIEYTRANEFASITLTVVLAYATFLGSEFISHHIEIGGYDLAISSIIATTIASIVMGNYGRPKIHPRAEEFVDKLWGQLAFMANSVIFIMVGILFTNIPLGEADIIFPIVISVFVVAFARALSIYPVTYIFNLFSDTSKRIPRSWQHLLSWGSLRGALAVTLVLLIPPDITIPGWALDIAPRDFILTLTIGCIFFTIFVKATTIQALMRTLKLDRMTELEKIEYQEACALTHREVAVRLKVFFERGYITEHAYTTLLHEHEAEYKKACSILQESHTETRDYVVQVLRMYAIGIEKKALKELYHYGEINETVYKRILGKLTVQLEEIEKGNLDLPTIIDGRDIFDRTLARIGALLRPLSASQKAVEQYAYYRAQSIISRKVLKELNKIHPEEAHSIFSKESLLHVIDLYTEFRSGSQAKMEESIAAYPDLTEKIGTLFASHGITKVEERVLNSLYSRELITPKLYVTLKEKFHVE